MSEKKSCHILLKDFPKLAIIRKEGMTAFQVNGEPVAEFEDYEAKGYKENGEYGVEFKEKGK